MNRVLKLSIVITLIWLIVSTLVIFNWIYVVYPEMGSGFWLVFARTHILLAILPLAIGWGGWWVIKK